jgi:hypothetical protein
MIKPAYLPTRQLNPVIFLTLLLLVCINGYSQITMQASDFPHAGMLVTRDVDSTTAISPGGAGLNQVWDFSNMVPSYTDSTLYMMMDGQPGSQNYPNANLVVKDVNTDSNYDGAYCYSFYESTPSGWHSYGEELKISFWGISFYWHFFLEPAVPELPLPFTYNDFFEAETNYQTYKSIWSGGAQVDSSLVIWHLSTSMVADGSGTIITPNGSFDALRVKKHFWGTDSTFTYNPTTGWVYGENNYSDFYTYTWYANGIGEVGSILDDGKKGSGSFSFFKSTTVVGMNEPLKNEHLKFYPNPVHDYLKIESDNLVERVEVYDNAGVLQKLEQSGNCINVSALLPGIYNLKVITKSVVSNGKFLKL